MIRLAAPLRRHRLAIASAGLGAAALIMLARHHAEDGGLAAADIDVEQAEATLFGPADEWHTGKLVLDLVEPEDGEGGSEIELQTLVTRLDQVPGVDIGPAGFYSEAEHLYVIRADAAAHERVRELLHSPLVEGVEPELVYSLPSEANSALQGSESAPLRGPRVEVNDPMFPLQWHMEQIHAPEAWSITRGDNTVVAVIDTGVAWRDGDGVRALPDLNQTRFTDGESFISGLPDGLDDHAHGSHVAGTIAQSTDNGIGVVGVAHRSTIMPLKVLSKDGRGSVPGIANAIRYAADHGAHVINMSLGGPLPSKVLAKAIEYAHGKGVVTVCAAGNERRSRVGYPAANKYAVAVSAVDYGRELTFYSNWGKDIDVAAPGGDTRADKNGDGQPDGVLQNTIKIGLPAENDYLWFQGTSMASPHAAGVAALIVSTGINNPDEVERIMKETAVHPKGAKWDQKYGAGIVDAQAAVTAAHRDYGVERSGLVGLLWLAIGTVMGGASLAARARWLGYGAALTAAAWTSGALGLTPLAYQLASVGGGMAGVAGLASLSALLPMVAALLFLGIRGIRPILVGVALGYAGLLLHGALVLPTDLALLPGQWLDRAWLLGNAAASGLLAWRVTRIR